ARALSGEDGTMLSVRVRAFVAAGVMALAALETSPLAGAVAVPDRVRYQAHIPGAEVYYRGMVPNPYGLSPFVILHYDVNYDRAVAGTGVRYYVYVHLGSPAAARRVSDELYAEAPTSEGGL